MRSQSPALQAVPRPVSGSLTLDVGAAVDYFAGRRLASATTNQPEDPAVLVRWTRYQQAQILGVQIAEKLEAHRAALMLAHARSDQTFEAYLVVRGSDVEAFVLESLEGGLLLKEEATRLQELLALPLLQRWSTLATLLVL